MPLPIKRNPIKIEENLLLSHSCVSLFILCEQQEKMLESVKNLIIFLSPTAKTHPQHWFNPPEFHATEFILYNIFHISLFLYCIYGLKPNRKPVAAKPKNNTTLFEHLLGLTLIICLIVQSVYNVQMDPSGLAVMLHPCHLLSLMELYLIYGRNTQALHNVFNLSVFFCFYTSLALLMPDTSDLYLPYHIEVFWIQHWVVYLIPFYFIIVKRFNLDNKDYYFALLAVATANLVYWNVMFPAALYTSINVNYALFPSPSSPPFLKSSQFKTIQGGSVHLLLVIHGFLTSKLFQKVSDKLYPTTNSNSTKSKKVK